VTRKLGVSPQVSVVALYEAGCETDGDESGEAGQKNDHDRNP
jgi:hypothetical protein